MITYEDLYEDLAISIATGSEDVSCENDILLAWMFIKNNSLATTKVLKTGLTAISKYI